jgi:hypothetical protein
MAIEGLEPCPFCGKVEALVHWNDSFDGMELQELLDIGCRIAICCSMHYGGCGATSGYRDTVEEVGTLWNTRVEQQPIWIRGD